MTSESHQARKRFGQNFLHDGQVIADIVQAIQPQPGEHLVEIGPGQGAITLPLLDAGAKLDIVELDRDLVSRLQTKFSGNDRVTIHSADALRFDFGALSTDEPLRIVGNLPYNISTPLLFHLLEYAPCIQDMHFMLQKEVVKRMAAEPGSKAFGRLSIMLQLHCKVSPLFDVAPECFSPAPKVVSSIVRLTPNREPLYDVASHELLGQVVNQAFGQRRKTMRNALRKLCSEDQLEAADIDPSARAETLSVADFVRLANLLATEQGLVNKP